MRMMIHILALSMDGIIQTMVAIIQPDTMPLANILLASFSMTLRPISRKARSVLVSKIGRCNITYATSKVPQRLPTSTTDHSRNNRPKLFRVGLVMTGSTAVRVFSVNNCWRARMTARNPAQ
ncbi:hypothetical protein D3C84_756960 [compost metagenome]